MLKENLINFFTSIKGTLKENAKLSHYTWLKVGGRADILYKPHDIEDLGLFLKKLDKNIAITIIGAGSNILISDDGIEGITIKLGKNFSYIEILSNNLIKAGASTLNFNLSKFCLENELGGLEFLSGIPGSIGGGIAMNAGCYGTEYKDIIESIQAIDINGNIVNYSNKEIGFLYRKNSLPKGLIFLSANIRYIIDKKENIKKKIDYISRKRLETQPIKERTGGSTFANPKDNNAWKLIDKVGMRGYRIGGAKFSEKHCNFMINIDNAKASDFARLGELAQKKVYDEFGIKLLWEIKQLGRKNESNER